MKLHAFVAMPFGPKPDRAGRTIDFDRVYVDLIRPALAAAGFEAFRADEELRAGDIRTDMFQELLVADLVVADLTLDNPNVWYELGVRHALRARGVVLIQGPRPDQPFDIYTDRKLRYRLTEDGVPDPASLEAGRALLARMARQTLDASVARTVSPVYTLFHELREPPWRELLLSQRNEFGQVYEAWKSRMEVARQKNRPGDILVLADETPTRSLWLEARRTAGECLMKLKHFDFALEQFEAVLAVNPSDRIARGRRIVCLGRVGQREEAHEAARRLTQDCPTDPEAWALAGRVEKERWIGRWRNPGAGGSEMRETATYELASLEEAIKPYHQAFIADPAQHYPGINSLRLHLLKKHLGGEINQAALDNLAGGVLWSALAAQERTPKDYWARTSHAELFLLLQPVAAATRAMRAAVAVADRDWFALDSTRQELTLLRDLQYRPDETAAVLAIIDGEIARVAPPHVPRQVLLFSGHMVDAPYRPIPRFPPAKVPAAAAEIGRALDFLDAGPGDLALTQGAAGGDLLFAELCVARGVDIQLLLPLPEPEFIQRSVLRSAGGEDWRERYYTIVAKCRNSLRAMPVELGPLPKGSSPFERCNLWLLYTALAFGPEKVRFVCLWDGSGGDGPGGTRHSYEEVQRRTGRTVWIKPQELDPKT